LHGKPHLIEAWSRDVVSRTKDIYEGLSSQHAKQAGKAIVRDAKVAVASLRKGDTVFIDPPYSGVHYSRFYHVLETVALGECGEVSGTGRYPDSSLRPVSKFSIKTKAPKALDDLLQAVAKKEAKAILTFPNHQCSNGLSGDLVREIGQRHFQIIEKVVGSRFSTLGGQASGSDKIGRAARLEAEELILTLIPK